MGIPQPAWANTFPHIHEIYLLDPSNPDNYFNHPNVVVALNRDPSDDFLVRLEKELDELNPAAWTAIKTRIANSISRRDKYGFNTQLIESLNEVKAYLYLKDHGYRDIEFITPPGKKRQRSPDLRARGLNGKVVLLEAKRMRDSDAEIEYLTSTRPHEAREVIHGLTDKLRAKVDATVNEARAQLLGYQLPQVAISQRIVFLSVWLDLGAATQATKKDLDRYLKGKSDHQVSIVHQLENPFYL